MFLDVINSLAVSLGMGKVDRKGGGMFPVTIEKSLLHAQLILNWQGGAPAKHVSVAQKEATGLMKRARIVLEWGNCPWIFGKTSKRGHVA